MTVLHDIGGQWRPRRARAADSFTRADNATVPGLTETGQLAWQSLGGQWGIVSNTAYQSTNINLGANETNWMVVNTNQSKLDMSLDVTTAQAGNGVGCGIIFRFGGTGSADFLFFTFNKSGAGALSWNLQRRIGGSDTTLLTGTPGAVTGTLRVVDDRKTIAVYLNGAYLGAVTETQLNTNTFQGICVFFTSAVGANDGTGWRFDNFAARSL